MPKTLVADTKNLLLKYASHKDRQNLLDDWNSTHCTNKVDKFIAFIRKVLLDNVARLENNEKAPKLISSVREIGSLFSIANQERIVKFMRRFEQMIKLYFLQPNERDEQTK